MARKKPDLGALSTRARNWTRLAGYETREQIAQAMADGKLHPYSKQRPKNFGWTSYNEVRAWLGLPEDPQRKVRVCPHCGGVLNAPR